MIKNCAKINGKVIIEATYKDVDYVYNVEHNCFSVVNKSTLEVYNLESKDIEDLRTDGFLVSALASKLIPLEDTEKLVDVIDYYLRGNDLNIYR